MVEPSRLFLNIFLTNDEYLTFIEGHMRKKIVCKNLKNSYSKTSFNSVI